MGEQGKLVDGDYIAAEGTLFVCSEGDLQTRSIKEAVAHVVELGEKDGHLLGLQSDGNLGEAAVAMAMLQEALLQVGYEYAGAGFVGQREDESEEEFRERAHGVIDRMRSHNFDGKHDEFFAIGDDAESESVADAVGGMLRDLRHVPEYDETCPKCREYHGPVGSARVAQAIVTASVQHRGGSVESERELFRLVREEALHSRDSADSVLLAFATMTADLIEVIAAGTGVSPDQVVGAMGAALQRAAERIEGGESS